MFKFQLFLAPAVVACVACGASFTSHDGESGALAGSGNAGEASGGLTSAAGNSSIGEAGEIEAGGTSSAGQGSTVGGTTSVGGSTTSTGGTTTSTGGTTTGMGGRNWGNGGRNWGNGGASTGVDCATLESDYRAAVERARVCTKGSTDECSASSVAQPVGGCGCPTLINAKSEAGAEAKRAYQAYQDAKCANNGGPVCDIYCPAPVTAGCAQQSMGPGTAFMCTTGIAL